MLNNRRTPEELWGQLVSLSPRMSPTTRPDLDMLRDAYWKNQQCAESQAVRESFETALKTWTDDQKREFVSKWLSEPSQLVGADTASSEQLQCLLEQVYKYIFG